MSSEMNQKIEKLSQAIIKSNYLAAFTGAGISTESGIPDFRGPKGIWKRYRPIELAEFISDPAARKEYWRRKIEIYPRIRKASANDGHRALARLHEAGFLQTVITQNIDSLHQKSGIPNSRVIELHGSNAYIACLDCQRRCEWEEVLPYFDEHEDCPRCDKCGGWLKPATISFGQAMPEAETEKAFQEAAMADVLLVIGSSLQVYPAAAIPTETERSGGLVAIINNEPTAQDHIAHIVLHDKAGEILKTLVNKILMKEY